MKRKNRGKRLNTHFEHNTIINDDNGPITFQWHWPRGTFDKRMSALELAEFVLPHMPHVLPLLSNNPRIYNEFRTMLMLLILSPKEALDKVLNWIKPVVRTQDDDIIELDFNGAPQLASPIYFT